MSYFLSCGIRGLGTRRCHCETKMYLLPHKRAKRSQNLLALRFSQHQEVYFGVLGQSGSLFLNGYRLMRKGVVMSILRFILQEDICQRTGFRGGHIRHQVKSGKICMSLCRSLRFSHSMHTP